MSTKGAVSGQLTDRRVDDLIALVYHSCEGQKGLSTQGRNQLKSGIHLGSPFRRDGTPTPVIKGGFAHRRS